MKSKTDPTGQWLKTFGYINIETTRQNFQKCRSQLNNTTWRDGKITIQLAKQSTSEKYATERQQEQSGDNHKEGKDQKVCIPEILKGAVPGTVLPDNENWVVTRYQRVVPVMKVRSRDKKKVTRYDPSRHSHQLKRLDTSKNELLNDPESDEGVACLTWDLGEDSTKEANDNYKQRIGDFKRISSADTKVKSGRGAEDIIQKRAEKENSVDDMEVVPVDNEENEQSFFKVSTKESVKNGVDLSRFDSDSESDTLNDSGTASYGVRKASTVKLKNLSSGSVDTKKLNIANSKSLYPISTKVKPNKNQNVPSDTLLAKTNLSSHESSDAESISTKDQHSKTPKTLSHTKDVTSDSSSLSSSDDAEDEHVKRKTFPGTAAILAKSVEPDSISGYSKTNLECANVNSEPRTLPIKVTCQEKMETSTSLASVQSANDTSQSPSSNLAWDLEQLLASSTNRKSDTPLNVTPSSLAILLESAASILRSAATQTPSKANEIRHSQNAPPKLNLSVSEDGSDSSSVNLNCESFAKSRRILAAEQERPRSVKRAAKSSQSNNALLQSVRMPSICKSSTGSDDDEEKVSQSNSMELSNGNGTAQDVAGETSGGKHNTTLKEPSHLSSDNSYCSDSSEEERSVKTRKLSKPEVISNAKFSIQNESVSSSEEDCVRDEMRTNKSKLDLTLVSASQVSENLAKPAKKKLKTKKPASTPKAMCNAEKRNLSNQKRLEALSSKKNEFRSQQEIVQKALRNMDTSTHRNRIVFDSEDEEEPTAKKPKFIVSKSATGNNKILFDESSEDEEENEEKYNKMFSVKPQFEGEKGAKLLELQKSFNDDSRFKLTEKFLDEDSDASSEAEKHKEPHSQPMEEEGGLEEKCKNLEILQSIVGSKSVRLDHPTSSRSKAKKLADTPATVFRDLSSMQFDPTSASHSTLLKKVDPSDAPKKAKKKAKKKEGTDPVVGNEPAPEITKERFFEVDIDFTKNKGEYEDGSKGMTFDFLGDENTADSEAERTSNSLGKKYSCVEEDSKEFETSKDDAVSAKYNNPFAKRDDSDDERKAVELESKCTGEEKPFQANVPAANSTVVDWFFFKPNDPRLKDGAKRFSNTLDDELLRQKWKEIRPKLVENYLTKSKRAVKKQRSSRTSVIKKRFRAKDKTSGRQATNTKA
ncbi:nucleolar protein 8-like isoform X2 [Watersipora subatra]|uniref:nucleolar protein 8-like isoform X2 n=1 Tax=Watersipora subatra TaxID=2589382 RepID=UPI00355C616D